MLPPFFIRSTLFNLLFYLLTGLSCVILLPTLVLPRNAFFWVVHFFVHCTAFLEKYVLGLRYEVRGLENLPDQGPYIIAAKHQSAYETFKLHILFKDPAIVLKKELLKIPLWGQYLGKSDVIAIDRSTPKDAIKSIQDGANRVAAQGREIIIFPQGTRVKPETTTQEKPYKIGIVRIQEATRLPIIPMALNTGVFYPKKGWCKKPGTVVFEFLPAIPHDPTRKSGEVLKEIQTKTEAKTEKLMQEGRASIPTKRNAGKVTLSLLCLVGIAYTGYWFYVASLIKQRHQEFVQEINANTSITSANIPAPHISGFPGKMNIHFDEINLTTKREEVTIGDTVASGWPFLGADEQIEMTGISLKQSAWSSPLDFESLQVVLSYWPETLTIHSSAINSGTAQGQIIGTVDFSRKPHPDTNLTLRLINHDDFMMKLVSRKIIKENAAMMASFTLATLKKDGAVTTTFTIDDSKVYLGPLKILDLPKPIEEATQKIKQIAD